MIQAQKGWIAIFSEFVLVAGMELKYNDGDENLVGHINEQMGECNDCQSRYFPDIAYFRWAVRPRIIHPRYVLGYMAQMGFEYNCSEVTGTRKTDDSFHIEGVVPSLSAALNTNITISCILFFTEFAYRLYNEEVQIKREPSQLTYKRESLV